MLLEQQPSRGKQGPQPGTKQSACLLQTCTKAFTPEPLRRKPCQPASLLASLPARGCLPRAGGSAGSAQT